MFLCIVCVPWARAFRRAQNLVWPIKSGILFSHCFLFEKWRSIPIEMIQPRAPSSRIVERTVFSLCVCAAPRQYKSWRICLKYTTARAREHKRAILTLHAPLFAPPNKFMPHFRSISLQPSRAFVFCPKYLRRCFI